MDEATLDYPQHPEHEVPETAGTCDTEHLFDKMRASGALLPERGVGIVGIEIGAKVDPVAKPMEPLPLFDPVTMRLAAFDAHLAQFCASLQGRKHLEPEQLYPAAHSRSAEGGLRVIQGGRGSALRRPA
jgi:hypothetical protein